MTALPIKFRASAITNVLRSQGVPISKLDPKRGVKRSGVAVYEMRPIIGFEWQDWGNGTDREAGQAQVIAALNTVGLTATAVEVNGKKAGAFRIHLLKKD